MDPIDDVWGWGVSREAPSWLFSTMFRHHGAMTKILDVPVVGQLTGFECGNTCLTAVARFFGRTADPATFAKLANTTSEGTDHAEMVEAAVASGATVFAKDSGTVDELARWVELGLPPIIGWWSMERGDVDWRHWKLR